MLIMRETKSNNLVKGALLLTFAGLLSKVLSAGYRIPLQNLTGDIGFYLYQQIYPIIGVIMILALYGFPVAVSTLTAEMNEQGGKTSFRHFHFPIILIMFLINGTIFLILYALAPYLASWIGDAELANAFKLIAFAFLLIPILAFLRGYFQGNEEMKQTAVSQITEQLFRVIIIITAAILIYKHIIPLQRIAEVGSIATLCGMVMGIISLLLFRQRNLRKVTNQVVKLPWAYIFRTCLSVGLIAALIHMILLIIQFADVLTFVPAMMAFGFSPLEAMEAKGIFDRGQPLIQFGAVIGSSFALALIPLAIRKRDHTATTGEQTAIKSAITLSFYLAAGATIGLILIFPEVNLLLFKSIDGTSALQMLAPAILLSSLAITASAILQSLGKMNLIALFVLITFGIKFMLNRVFIPIYGMPGASLATIGALFVLCTIIMWYLKRKLHLFVLGELKWFAFIVATVGMTVYLLAIKGIATFITIPSRLGLLIFVIFLVITGVLVFVSLLLRYRAFSDVQLAALPFSRVVIELQQFLEKK